ncbi:MAG: DNA-formamidopyrimidine glycosylase family protein [Solirubrobacterales bacterium]
MAEGDTVFRWAVRLREAFDGRKVIAASAPNPRSPLRQTAQRLVGNGVDDIETFGKHLIINFTGGLSLHAHMGMGGGWYVYRPKDAWKRQRRSAWLILDLGGIEVVQFGGPTMRLVRKIELRRDSRLAGIGADLLDPDFDVEEGAAIIASAPESELGVALLNQHLLAGIGNIYKSESCWAAKLDPWRPVDSFDRDELELVVGIARKQLQTGVDTGQRPKTVYRRAGRPCPRCRGRIRSRGQGLDNRTTYWCGNCQK